MSIRGIATEIKDGPCGSSKSYRLGGLGEEKPLYNDRFGNIHRLCSAVYLFPLFPPLFARS